MGCLQINPRFLPSHLFFSLLFFILHTSFSLDDESYIECAPTPFNCGILYNISYPFSVQGRSQNCSYPGFTLTCDEETLITQIGSKTLEVKAIDYESKTLTVINRNLIGKSCPLPLENITIESSLFQYSERTLVVTLYHNCSNLIQGGYPEGFRQVPCYTSDGNYAYYTMSKVPDEIARLFINCRLSLVPMLETGVNRVVEDTSNLSDVLADGFNVSWSAGDGWCGECVKSNGSCGYHPLNDRSALCFCKDGPHFAVCNGPMFDTAAASGGKRKTNTNTIIGVVTGAGALLVCIIALFWCRRKRFRSTSLALLSSSKSLEPSSKHDLEKCNSNFFHTHVFTYEELEEATNNFDDSKELGEGGFGTVYYGKLRDGRSVAVKRLYENNYKRVEQFMNEVEILSSLRHQNLVSLYGCTSRHSRELLLVYEFVPNGTVADHLHGALAQTGPVTWPTRMSIAIETAGALAYLHAIEHPIIHRDVKTNNILLDNNFHVKVADFGLSRLFPVDVTHVSTAPQGTPGYVDPDYHKCYQLTDKSDVYSFGVVLVELISSKPAVDVSRHRDEINLAYMAIKKIHNHALHELVDLDLGFESDYGVRRMITLVAELAFRCLQEDRDVRPAMEEVLEVLRGIESDEYPAKKVEQVDVTSDDVGLIMKTPSSPDTVMDAWASRSTTPNTSG
ncbi:LEAF RUST 10 DISEASE-RESISTANCE LOCUS RECEPTOR-LIKE PROTEIN KINASE-like 1.2 isoform X2 [Tasmannia lanceolata]|uniref:LEAF RUST 10 DISEASE-RESISTANCE LOCUS RECEPTOR-LIKE PROTEIN KINASE-like 1.2 isoform X2 n=1 Tax=Tasmannia lanceolata TaxID=3420 RepID=UPI0040642433